MNEGYIISLIGRAREKANKYIEEELAAIGVKDLSASHGAILGTLYRNNGKAAMNYVVSVIDKSKSTVSDMVNKLEKCGYIIKTPDENDRRSLNLELTEKSWAIKEDFILISKKLIEKVYVGFSDEEKKNVTEMMIRINNNLRENN